MFDQSRFISVHTMPANNTSISVNHQHIFRSSGQTNKMDTTRINADLCDSRYQGPLGILLKCGKRGTRHVLLGKKGTQMIPEFKQKPSIMQQNSCPSSAATCGWKN